MRVIARRATMLAGDRSQGVGEAKPRRSRDKSETKPRRDQSCEYCRESRNFPNCVHWHVFYFYISFLCSAIYYILLLLIVPKKRVCAPVAHKCIIISIMQNHRYIKKMDFFIQKLEKCQNYDAIKTQTLATI